MQKVNNYKMTDGVCIICMYRCAVDAFRGLLKTAECEELLKIMDENDFDKLVGTDESLPHGMLFVAR